MKRCVYPMILTVLLLLWSPFHLGNAYLRSDTFDRITVKRQDTVWSIAEHYAGKSGDVRELVEAIIEVNGLRADGSIRAGQQLSIPVLEAQKDLRLAER